MAAATSPRENSQRSQERREDEKEKQLPTTAVDAAERKHPFSSYYCSWFSHDGDPPLGLECTLKVSTNKLKITRQDNEVSDGGLWS